MVIDIDGFEALAKHGTQEIILQQLVILAGRFPENSNPMKAIYESAFRGHYKVVRQMLENGADVNAKDNGGTPLLQAVWRGGFSITGRPWAPGGGHEAVVRLLLEKGADVNTKDYYGWTALDRAAANQHEAVVQLLLEKGADANATDDGRYTV